MAGLFDPSFRGAGSPGAPGVGTTQRGLQLVEQGKIGLESQQLGLQTKQDETRLDSIVSGIQQTSLIPSAQGKLEFLKQRAQQLESEGRDSSHTQEGIELLTAELQGGGDGSQFNQTMSDLLAQTRIGKGGASARAFAPQTIRKVVGQNEKGEDVFGLFSRQTVFDPATNKSTVNETRIEGDLVTSTGETITQQRVEEVKTAGLKKEAEVSGAATGKAKSAPLIAKTESLINTAVKLAEKEAAARGETLTDLKRLEAGLPATRQMVDQLRELAPIATSTLGGRAFDFAVKESGFGATKGADARVKFASIASNQALPLLRQMLGPAFTAEEGKRVLALLGDVNATPSQKMLQLDAFIEGKVRSVQSKQREVGADVTLTEELTTGQEMFSEKLGRAITETDITETLQANPGLTREDLLQQLGVN